jgi:hypothetical protein
LTTFEANQLLKRFDSNFDGHLTQTDVHEVFAPNSDAMKNELMKRTLSDSRICEKIVEYIRDVFENLVDCSTLAQTLKDNLSMG